MNRPNERRVVTSSQTPILRVEGVLIASIQQSLDDDAVLAFESALLERVAAEGATGVVIDITAVDVVDSFMARSLNDIAAAVALLGTRLAIVGIQPAAAITLVKMGFTIPNAITALDLEQGLRLLRRTMAEEPAAAPAATDE
jgi:rsbT antagonist protein RsbS